VRAGVPTRRTPTPEPLVRPLKARGNACRRGMIIARLGATRTANRTRLTSHCDHAGDASCRRVFVCVTVQRSRSACARDTRLRQCGCARCFREHCRIVGMQTDTNDMLRADRVWSPGVFSESRYRLEPAGAVERLALLNGSRRRARGPARPGASLSLRIRVRRLRAPPVGTVAVTTPGAVTLQLNLDSLHARLMCAAAPLGRPRSAQTHERVAALSQPPTPSTAIARDGQTNLVR
jgi:hypothetical protein